MREEVLAHKLREIAKEDMPEGADLWPVIVTRVRRERVRARHRNATRGRFLAIALIAVALALVLVTGGSIATAKVGDMLQRFGIVLLGPEPGTRVTQPAQAPVGTWSQPRQVEAGVPHPVDRPLEEVQRQVDFQIRTPTWLPDGIVLRGAVASGDGQAAVASYRAIRDPNIGLSVQMRRGRQAGGYGVPASAIEDVWVHGVSAVYARGAWTKDGTWNDSADAHMLSWEDKGFTYYLSSSGLGLSREDLVRIAESLSP